MSTITPDTRAKALEVAGRIVSTITLDPPGHVDDLYELTTDLAERWAYWITNGRHRARGESR